MGTFNVALGRVVTYYENVKNSSPANSAFVIVFLQSSGLENDATIVDHATLASLLSTNDEADFTNYSRKVLVAADLDPVPSPDNDSDSITLHLPLIEYTDPGGATNNTIGMAIVCYSGDTVSDTDADIIPLTSNVISWTTDGNTVHLTNSSGFFEASNA